MSAMRWDDLGDGCFINQFGNRAVIEITGRQTVVMELADPRRKYPVGGDAWRQVYEVIEPIGPAAIEKCKAYAEKY